MTIRVLVADDQELVRTGLSMILDAQPDIDVVGQAVDGRIAQVQGGQRRGRRGTGHAGGQGGGALQAFFLHGATHTEFGEKTASRRLEVYARFYF